MSTPPAFRRLKGRLRWREGSATTTRRAAKYKHPPQLLKRLAPKIPLVLFVNQRENRLTAFGYTNGTWFQMVGQKGEDGQRVVWAFTHCEPYLRRTFKGTTAEMRQAVID